MKKIIFYFMIFVCIILIYFKFNIREDISLCFGNDIKCNYNYNYNDIRIDDIIRDINNNIRIRNRSIQNLIIKSNSIYIDLNNLYLNKNSFGDINKFFDVIRKFSKEKVFVILRSDNDIMSKDINIWIFKISKKYDIIVMRGD